MAVVVVCGVHGGDVSGDGGVWWRKPVGDGNSGDVWYHAHGSDPAGSVWWLRTVI